MRKFPAAVAVAALLALPVVPAYAAPGSAPAAHKFTVRLSGVKAWGSYAKSGGRARITLCVKDTSRTVRFAMIVGVAMNASFTKHQSITAQALGTGKQSCRVVTTTRTGHLTVIASSVGTNGSTHVSKMKTLY